jgi:tetratricopeptide (TPR) repeat protein
MSLFLLLLLCSFTANKSLQANPSEGTKIDSLKQILQTTTHDSVQFITLCNLSWEYISTDQFDSAEYYATHIKKIAKQTDNQNRLALGEYYLGCIARHRGRFQKSLNHLDKYITWHEQSGDSVRLAYGLFQIGAVHTSLGNYDESLSALYRILRIYEVEKRYFDIGYTLNGIGIVYKNSQKYADAIETYQKALTIYDTLDAPEDKGIVLVNLANVYTITEKYDQATYYYQQALVIMESIGLEEGVAFALENLGEAYKKMEEYDSALIYQTRALAIRERSPNNSEHAATLQQVGHTNYLLQNYSTAKVQLKKALKLALETNSKPVLRDTYASLVDIFEEENDYQQAFEYQKLWTTIKDSLFNTNVSKQINELQTKYETEEKEKQIVLLAKEKETQANEARQQATVNRALLGGLILVSIIAGLVYFLFRQRLKNQKLLTVKNEEVKTAKFKQQLSELEMKALRAQMNPHFIFNCLNSINRMVLSGESYNAGRYLTKFAKLIRLMLENSEYPTVTLEDELAMLEAYLELECLRFKEKISYRITVDETLDRETTRLPSMVLQPFIENAIWHGLIHKEEQGIIHIGIYEGDFGLKCIIQDNGVGREQSLVLQNRKVLKKRSLGIKITEERLKLFNKEQLQELIRITDLKDSMNRALGTRVDILIPTS